MGLINKYSKGDWVNQNRKSQGGVLEKQDAKSRFFSEKMNNGNNIQKKTTAKIDDLPNIPAMLGSAPSQDSIKPIDGGTAHTPTTQALLPFLTLLSAAFPNTTAPPNKAIDNSNSSLSRVTSPTKVNTHVLFGTTPSTSKNHAQSKKLTKHSDDPSLIREKDGLIRHDDGNIILGSGGSKLTVSYDLDIKILKEQLTNNINITELCLWALKIDPQEVQEIGEILKGSNVEVLSILHSNIRDTGTIDFGRMLTNTKVTILNLAYNGIGNKGAIGLIESLEGTNVEELNLSHNGIGKTGKGAKGFITLLKKTKVKVVDLSHNNMSDKKVNDIIPELEKNTKIIVLGLRGMGIKHDTLKEVLKVLKQNKHVNEKSYTSTVESSTTEEKASTTEEKSPNTSNKREKRDVHTTSSTEDTTVPTTEESTVPTTLKSSTTTTEPTTPTTVSTTTTESTVPTTDGSSTTTTKSTASSAGNPTTLKEELTTPKKNLTEKPEPIAADVVVDSITEKHTPKESNPNDPASSTMSTKEILALISFVLTAVSIGGGVAICVVKKFFDGASRLGHNALALADLAESDNHLDNNEKTSSLTGVTVNDDMD